MKNRGFTLVELLIVVALMAIVYGIYFFTILEKKRNIEFSIKNMKEYLNNASKTYGNRLKLIYYFDEKIIYLANDKSEPLESIDFDKPLTQYILKDDEQLEVKHYKAIEFDDKYFEPTFIYERLGDDLFANIILNNSKGEWLYFDTYFTSIYTKFKDENNLINFIKKKEYLPMYAGKIE